MVQFVVIWYIFPVWTKKNLATLVMSSLFGLYDLHGGEHEVDQVEQRVEDLGPILLFLQSFCEKNGDFRGVQ
jgi:hypothetical protein